MKQKVVSIFPEATIREAAELLIQKHVGTLVVVNEEKHLLGLIQMRDLISLAIPNFIDLFKKKWTSSMILACWKKTSLKPLS
jgi:CBS domain-containing protein